jgi:META domain
MKPSIFVLLIQVLLPRAAQSIMFSGGKYSLSEVFDAKEEPVQLPVGRFDLQVAPVERDGAETESETVRYRYNLKIGNMLGGSFEMTRTTNELAKMGPMRSTMMMPPQELYALENRLNKMFPAVTELDLEEGKLVFKGSEGSIVFKELVE